MILLYNGKRKNDANRLSMKRLYSKEASIFDVLENDEKGDAEEEPGEGQEALY